MNKLIPIAALGLALAGCNTQQSASINTVLSNALAYACPVALGIQTSTLKLTAAEMSIINTAVSDCQQWQSNPNTSFTSPATVASILIQAAELLQANANVPEETKIAITRAKLRIELDLRRLHDDNKFNRNL